MTRSGKILLILIILGGGGLAASRGAQGALGPGKGVTETPKITVQDTPVARDGRLTASYAPIVRKVAPSVVNVYSTKIVRESSRNSPFLEDPFFRRFFELDRDDRQGNRRPRTREEQSLGSGVIVTADGYILTNNHVVEDSDEIKVALADDKRIYDAKVVGTDPQTDIAVLKVSAKGLPAITIADSDKLEVGDLVLAVGNPFNLGQTVTLGIVSALGRGGFNLMNYEDFIQTDASINPGNSGGPLADTEGRLVGINTFIISRTGGNQGVGFAVPINLARDVMDRLIKDGKVTRGFLGVYIQPITPDLAEEFKLPSDQAGALVGGVNPDSPADRAGVKPGDVIIESNGKKVSDSRHFRLMVAQTPPGTKITLRLWRDGKEKTLTATLEELKTDQERPRGESRRRYGRAESEYETLDGVEVADLDSRTRRQLDIPAGVRGALVTNVDPESSAYRAGLRSGDVIVEINRQPVRNANDAVDLSEKNKSGRILLQAWNQEGSHFLVVEQPKRRP